MSQYRKYNNRNSAEISIINDNHSLIKNQDFYWENV